ncbi:hypothetical protein B0H11DRAFT_2223791 [Mycena galericulata]|nr:hypothetical protein B0H11DRAFT_2223791 [Mycena galericulata]
MLSFDGHRSPLHLVPNGFPQGSPLSALLLQPSQKIISATAAKGGPALPEKLSRPGGSIPAIYGPTTAPIYAGPAAPSANPRVLPTPTSQSQSTSAPTSASTPESTATPAPPFSNPRVIPTPLSPSAPTHPPMSPTSPTAASKLPRFLQSPAQRDRSKSLSVDRPPSAASSASHATSNSTSTSSSRRSGALPLSEKLKKPYKAFLSR